MRPPRILTIALASVLLAACGSSPDAPTAAETTSSSTSSSSTSKAPIPGETACALFMEGDRDSLMWRIPDAINGLDASATQEQVDAMLEVHNDLQVAANHAPDDLADALLKLDEPFADFAEQLRSSDPAISIHTGNVMTDVTDVMETCVDYGFRVSDAQ